VTLTTLRPCYLCKRDVKDDCYVRVSWPDGLVHDVCDDCIAKADEGEPWDERLDMTTEDDE
jgi:hypothetical protein